MGWVGRAIEWVLVNVVLRAVIALTLVFVIVYVLPSIALWLVGK